MSASMISVIMPTYNCGSYIGRAIESVCSQRDAAADIIVVDDGSVDNTAAIVDRYRRHWPIRYISQKNSGPSAARNAGIRASSARYLAFLDADDTLSPDALSLMARSLDESDSDWCLTDVVRVGDHGGDVQKTVFPQNVATGILAENFIQRAMFFRRTSLIDIGMWDETLRSREDWELYIRMIHARRPFSYIEAPIYEYRRRAGSITATQHDVTLACTRSVLHKHHKRLADAGDTSARELFAACMWDVARRYFYHRQNVLMTMTCLYESCLYSPRMRHVAYAAMLLPLRVLARGIKGQPGQNRATNTRS